MSSSLKSAAESTVHALSDLVEGARDRIEDLPPLARARRKRNDKRVLAVAIVGALALTMFIVRRCRHSCGNQSTTEHLDETRSRR
jgi:hypothetical protein